MSINLQLPNKRENLKPSITVIGVGGAGGNAVNNMIAARLEGVNFVVANTDAQALDNALTDRVIQLGANITQGLGAGACPDVGRASAEEAMDELMSQIEGSHMVFITAGMGGGTGTGAAPVLARAAKEQGILTVAVVTKPFHFEGTHRMKLAESGLNELQKYVDTMIVIPNQNLFRIANEKTTFADAFRMADEVLHSGVRGVTDLMVMPGLINLDFSDIRTVMREMGKAMMGTGEAEGERRAIQAAEAAISNPLLDDVSMKGARGVLINVTGGPDMTLFEVDEAANRIRDEVDPDANIIFGSTFNDAMQGKMRVSVVATGIDQQKQEMPEDQSGGGMRRQGPVSFTFSSRAPRTAMPQTAESAPVAAMTAPHSAAPEMSAQPVDRRTGSAMMQQASRNAAAAAAFREEEEEIASGLTEEDQGGFSFAQPSALQASATQTAPQPQRVGRHAPTRAEAGQGGGYQGEEMMHQAPQQAGEEHHYAEGPHLGSGSRSAQAATGGARRQAVSAARQPELWQEEEAAESDEGGSGPNLLRRMTARFSSREEQQAVSAAPRRAEVTHARRVESEEDYLEIPAFLRRQAN